MNPPADRAGPRLRWRRFWLAAGCLLLMVLLGLALVPLPQMVTGELLTDKVWHALAFALLMLWFAGLYPRHRYLLVFLALTAYGVLMELLQAQVPNRYAEFADLLADLVGLATGWLLAFTPLSRWPHFAEHLLGVRHHD